MTVTATDRLRPKRSRSAASITSRRPVVSRTCPSRRPGHRRRPSRTESIRSLRLTTGESIARCTVAWDRRDEAAFGGDPVLSLVTLGAESAEDAADAEDTRERAATLRREKPELDRLFPLAA